MNPLDILGRGRVVAEGLMTATCRITREGEKVWNEDTMQYDHPVVTVYEGKCRWRPTGQQAAAENAADQSFVDSLSNLSLPVEGSESVQKNDDVTVLTCSEDAGLVGRKAVVVFAPAYSHGTARRFRVREAQ